MEMHRTVSENVVQGTASNATSNLFIIKIVVLEKNDRGCDLIGTELFCSLK